MKLFVYGTLKSDKSRSQILESAKLLGHCVLDDKFSLYYSPELDYPLLYPSEVSHYIHGEIYEVPKDMFQYLDKIEGHPQLFKRVRATVIYGDKTDHYTQKQRALVYKTEMPLARFGIDTKLLTPIDEF